MGLLNWWWSCPHKQDPKVGIKKFPAPPPPDNLLDRLNDILHHIRDDLNTDTKVDQSDVRDAIRICDEIKKYDCSMELLACLADTRLKLKTLYIEPETSETKLFDQIKNFNEAYYSKRRGNNV